MAIDHIVEQAGGPAIVGTRITVDDVLLYLLDPVMTEDSIARLLDLTGEQVAAAGAFILTNPDTVLARHLQIEAKSAPINPPEVIDRAKRTHESLLGFKAWLTSLRAAEAREDANANGNPGHLPSFREWLAERESRPATGN